MRDVFLTDAGVFLPGDPVSTEEMITHLGAIDDQSERLGRLILRQNKIATRYYVPRDGGAYAHTNAQMAARAACDALDRSGLNADEIDLLATATTQGDLLVPGHGSAVHAELAALAGVGALEVASFQSVCASSLMAAKQAFLSIRTGNSKAALVTGSEFSSRWFQPEMYHPALARLKDKETRMAAEFLRWTLSDGAGALVLQDRPGVAGVSLRIDWVEMISLAHQFDTCMYAGIAPAHRYDMDLPWSQYEGGPLAAVSDGAVLLLQDMVLLKRIIRAWVGEYLRLVDEGRIEPDAVDHLLCHYSAHSLREEIIAILQTTGGMIDEAKWFSNLATKGNTGAGALFIMIEEFMRTCHISPGEKILCIVPESGRAMVGFMMLTAVKA